MRLQGKRIAMLVEDLYEDLEMTLSMPAGATRDQEVVCDDIDYLTHA